MYLFAGIIMSDSINSDIIINNTGDKNDDVIGEKSVLAEKTHVGDDGVEWSIVYFETDEDEDIEGFNDLIPSSWIIRARSLCWYPMNEHQATLQKYVKQCVKADTNWNCYSIKKIEEKNW